MQLTDMQQQAILQTARTGIIAALQGNANYQIPNHPDPLLTQPAGCFVTLHELNTHRLRGCVGRLQSDQPLLLTIWAMAHSVIADPRFVDNPVTLAMLPALDLEISVLSPLVAAATPLDFDPPNDGIFLQCAGRTGTFLPQVARDTGWSREQLLARLCAEKMGLAELAWQDASAKLLKYNVEVIGPVPFGPAPTPTTIPDTGATGGFGGGNMFRI